MNFISTILPFTWELKKHDDWFLALSTNRISKQKGMEQDRPWGRINGVSHKIKQKILINMDGLDSIVSLALLRTYLYTVLATCYFDIKKESLWYWFVFLYRSPVRWKFKCKYIIYLMSFWYMYFLSFNLRLHTYKLFSQSLLPRSQISDPGPDW